MREYQLEENYLGKYSCLIVDGNFSNEIIEIMKDKSANVLRLSSFLGWEKLEIILEKECDFIVGIELYSSSNKIDFSFLDKLPALEYLAFDLIPKTKLDLTKYPSIQRLMFDWHKNITGFERLIQLRTLHIDKYPYTTLDPLNRLEKLEDLILSSKKIESSEGTKYLTELRTVDLFRCPKLSSIKELNNCKKLQTIEIDTCKNINEFPNFELPNLGKLHLENCGKLESLDFLRKQQTLDELFIINTSINNSKIEFLAKIKGLQKIVLPEKYMKIITS